MAQPPPTLDSQNGSKQSNLIASEASIQESVNLVTPDPNGSNIPLDRSYWLQQDKFKNIKDIKLDIKVNLCDGVMVNMNNIKYMLVVQMIL